MIYRYKSKNGLDYLFEHEKEFTPSEFNKIVNEALKYSTEREYGQMSGEVEDDDYVLDGYVDSYLIDEYGFKRCNPLTYWFEISVTYGEMFGGVGMDKEAEDHLEVLKTAYIGYVKRVIKVLEQKYNAGIVYKSMTKHLYGLYLTLIVYDCADTDEFFRTVGQFCEEHFGFDYVGTCSPDGAIELILDKKVDFWDG